MNVDIYEEVHISRQPSGPHIFLLIIYTVHCTIASSFNSMEMTGTCCAR